MKNGGHDMKSRTNTILLVLILIFAMLAALFTGLGYFRGQDGQDETSYKEQTDKEIADKIDSCYRQVREKTDFKPDIAIVLGSGLGDFADNIDVEGTIPYSEIKGFPVSTAPGHAGEFVYGTLGDKKVICMKGRVHLYEGYTPSDVVLPLRIMRKMGAKILVLTNAAGGLNKNFKVGDFMLITDHISMFVRNPLIGGNIDELGTRFPSMTDVYDEKLQTAVRKSAAKYDIPLKEGVYIQLSGPSYETKAELKAIRNMGADAVGMSTVIEAIAAKHAGFRVCGISCITNMASDLTNKAPSEQEVIDSGKKSAEEFQKLLIEAIKEF